MSPHLPALWALRLVAGVHALMALSQPLSIGTYLDGVIGALSWHRGVGASVLVVTMLAGALALLVVLLRGSPRHLIPPAALFVIETAQIATGSTRVLAVHVLLGVATVLAAAWYAVWLWRPTATRPRPSHPVPARVLPQGPAR